MKPNGTVFMKAAADHRRLTPKSDSEETSLREIYRHIEQAKEISQSIGQDLLCYLLDNAQEEVQHRLGGSRRRKSS